MENETHEVEHEGVHAPSGMVDLIAEESQRNIEFRIVGRECRFEALPRDFPDNGILVNEHAVIPADEAIPEGCSVDKECQTNDEADGEESLFKHKKD